MLLIVGVGGGGLVVQDLHILDGRDEQGVGAQVDALGYLAAEVGVDALVDVVQAVGGALTGGEAVELVYISAGLHAEPLEEIEPRPLIDGGHGKHTGLENHIMGKICLIDRNGELIGLGCHLDGGVDDAAVVFLTVLSGENKQAVGELVHGQSIHGKIPP